MAAMQWIGEVEDGKSIDGLITSASITGKPIPDFENLDFKIASGHRKIQTGNLKQRVDTAEGKAQSLELERFVECPKNDSGQAFDRATGCY